MRLKDAAAAYKMLRPVMDDKNTGNPPVSLLLFRFLSS